MRTSLGIFAKYWQPGEVKTRLAEAIGPQAAARLHRTFVQTLLTRMAGVADACVLAHSPADRRREFEELIAQVAPSAQDEMSAGRRWRLQPQSSGDLGQRMRHFFEDALAQGAERVVLIGSDSPTLPLDYVRRAFDELRQHQIVLGPSEDGGYYLVGSAVRTATHVGSAVRTKTPNRSDPGPQSGPYELPPIFEDMPWSTPQVWPETLKRLERARASFAVLPPWYDVDGPADLHRLRAELQESTDGDLQCLTRALESIPAASGRSLDAETDQH